MIQLPKKLHHLEIFEQDGQHYVADLDRERILPITEVQAEVLKHTEHLTIPQLITALQQRYEIPEIFGAVTQLGRWAKLGLIFSPFPPQPAATQARPHRIFVMHDLLYWPPPPKHPAHGFQNYRLVTELAKQVSIQFAIPEEKSDEIQLDEAGIEAIKVKSGREFSPLWYALGNVDAVLALSSGTYEDLPFYCQSNFPVLARIYSEGREKETIFNKLLAKAALTRPYDALVVDASWVKTELALLLPDVPNVVCIPDGIDFQQLPPFEKLQARSALTQGLAIGKDSRPIVGLVLGTARFDSLQIASEIAAQRPDWMLLLYDENLSPRWPELPENLRCFGASQYTDPYLLPIVLRGVDVLFFSASVGSPTRLLSAAMACGTPLVIASRARIAELGEDVPHVLSQKTTPVWRDDMPWASAVDAIAGLLSNRNKRQELAETAKQQAALLTWENQVKAWVSLLEQLKVKQTQIQSRYQPERPVLFCRFYDKGSDTVHSQAMVGSQLARHSVEEGLLFALRQEHTATEVALVHRWLNRTPPIHLTHETSSTASDGAWSVNIETEPKRAASGSSTSSVGTCPDGRPPDERSPEVAPFVEKPPVAEVPSEVQQEHALAMTAIESKFGEHAPYATNYLRKKTERLIKLSPFTALNELNDYLQRSEGFWRHFDDLLADILAITGCGMEALLNPPPSQLTQDAPSFEAIKENWYETPYYPISEHLNYIDFEPALFRARFILKHLTALDQEQATFLDLGFGPGVLSALILQTKPGWQGHGVDISFVCRDYAQKLLERKGVADRAHLCIGDVRQLPYPDKHFDLIVGMEVFEHIPNPQEGLSEAVRVLKPGGYAITALPVQLPLKMHLYVFKDTQEVLSLYPCVGLNVLDFQEKLYQLPQRKFTDTFALSERVSEGFTF